MLWSVGRKALGGRHPGGRGGTPSESKTSRSDPVATLAPGGIVTSMPAQACLIAGLQQKRPPPEAGISLRALSGRAGAATWALAACASPALASGLAEQGQGAGVLWPAIG